MDSFEFQIERVPDIENTCHTCCTYSTSHDLGGTGPEKYVNARLGEAVDLLCAYRALHDAHCASNAWVTF